MTDLDNLLQKLEQQAIRCHAAVDHNTAQSYAQKGLPLTPGFKAELEQLFHLCQQAANIDGFDFLQSPRGFYLSAYPLIGLALLQIFDPSGPTGQLPERVRAAHIARRLYRLPDDLSGQPEAEGADWSTMNDLLNQQINGVITSTFEQHKATKLAQFFSHSPEQFDLLYQAGRQELISDSTAQ